MDLITFFDRFTFPEYIIAVIVFVEVIKAFVKPSIHPKWVTLIVAIVCAVVQIWLDPAAHITSWWKLLISLGIAVVGYDYLIKPIKDKVLPPST